MIGLLFHTNKFVRHNAAYVIGHLAQFGAVDKSTIPLSSSEKNGMRDTMRFYQLNLPISLLNSRNSAQLIPKISNNNYKV